MPPDVNASLLRYPHFERLLNTSVELSDGARLEVRETDHDPHLDETLNFDVWEMPIVRYIAGREVGFEWSAIPVFVTRRFVQWMVEVPEGSDIREAKDLEGKRIATRYNGYTDAIWTKGVLEDDYDVDLSGVSWFTVREEVVPGTVAPEGVVLLDGADPNDLLIEGSVDAALIEGYGDSAPGVRHLWPEPEREAARWYGSSRCFPILSLIVVKDAALAAHESLARDLYRIFEVAKQEALVQWNYGASLPEERRTSALKSGFPGGAERSFLDRDPIPYGLGVEANVDALERVIRYAAEQHAIKRRYAPEELLASIDSRGPGETYRSV